MTSERPETAAPGRLAPQAEARLADFERAWREGHSPRIEAFLPSEERATAESQDLLWELIAIDIEFCWRSARQSQARGESGKSSPASLESYLARFEALAADRPRLLELIAEEYRVRHRWGDRPHPAGVIARFPEFGGALRERLSKVDRELRDEEDPGPRRSGSVRAPSARPPGSHDPSAPLESGDYLLQKMIGAGGMGRVYRARQHSLDRAVAVKFLRKAYLDDPDAVERFLTEARTVAKLRHPGLVGVHGLGRTPGGGYFIVMDLVEGRDLARVAASGPVAVEQAVSWVVQAADAIHHAHCAQIVHCDLKPANLLLDKTGRIIVTDFGLARPLTPERTAFELAGTAAYMAPEQVDPAAGSIGVWTDVYALGAVLYTLLSGRPPYEGRRRADILARVLSGAVPKRLGLIRPGIPESVETVCESALCKKTTERFAGADAMASALREACVRRES